MGKKPFPKRASGGFRSSSTKFFNTAGIEPKRIGGKKVRKAGQEVEEIVLYSAPPIETPVIVPEIKLSFGESLRRSLWSFVRRERG